MELSTMGVLSLQPQAEASFFQVPEPERTFMEVVSHPFESNTFLECWWENLAVKFSPDDREGTLFKAQKPVLGNAVRLHLLRLAGWNGVYYQNLNETHWEDFDRLSRRNRWDCLELRWNEIYTDPQTFSLFERSGYKVIHTPKLPTPVIHLYDGWEDYWRNLGARRRQDMDATLKKASPLEPYLTFFQGEEGLEDFFERFFPLHRYHWREQEGGSCFEDARERAFILNWAKKLQQAGQLRLAGLSLGGEIASLSMNIVYNNVLYGLLRIHTGIHPEIHAGTLALRLLIQNACAEGIEKIDLGPGDSPFKQKFATHMEPCYQTLIINPKSLPGLLYGAFKARSKN